MRKVKAVLRLRYDLQLSYSQIRRSCGISNLSVTHKCLLGFSDCEPFGEIGEA